MVNNWNLIPSKTIFILDTSAIIHFQSVLPEQSGVQYAICTSVLNELKSRLTQYRFQVLEAKNQILYLDPSPNALKHAVTAANTVGSLRSLSKVDIDIIALAIDLVTSSKNDFIVITNDFAIQNVCSYLNIPFKPTEMALKIKEEIKWLWICCYCGKPLESSVERCINCGGPAKRIKKKNYRTP